jgi:uncharacterized repeat protein (TIGR03803 family)
MKPRPYQRQFTASPNGLRFAFRRLAVGYLGLLIVTMAMTAAAQTYTTLVNFTGSNGANPLFAVLVQGADGNLYGTTSSKGGHSKGTVFQITPSGTLTTIYSFCAKSKCSDGSTPYGGLVLGNDGNFYGTTFAGGFKGYGSVYKITPHGILTTLHNFTLTDGANPYDSLLLASDGNFYGTTESGGAHLLGTVFKITPSGIFTKLHSFNDSTDGSDPEGALIQAEDGNLYGTTYNGGSSGGYGTVFKITTSGTLTTLHTFNDETDGRAIVSGLVEGLDGNFYGTATLGGANGYGTVYQMTPSGTFTNLHNFATSEGASPNLLLLGSDGNFYSTTITSNGGNGMFFEITSSGVFTEVYNPTGSTGSLPFDGPAQATNGTFYGTTQVGGTNKDGTVFSLSTGLGPFVANVPAAGPVGTSVQILGNNLTGTTSVTFNGLAASFTVVSDTLITATVPSGATTGAIQVTTPGGALTSKRAFVVTH